MASTTLAWGLRLALLTAGVAYLLCHFQILSDDFSCSTYPLSLLPGVFSFASESSEKTYCYKSLYVPHYEGHGKPNCFTVDTKTGKFTKVFSSSNAEEHGGGGGHAIPGLWDGHGHLIQYGEFLHSVDLFGSTSFEEARERIKKYLATHPDVGTRNEWIRGVGWDQGVLGGMPTAEILEGDEDLKGKYVMLDRVDVHCTWVSKAVLDLLGGDIPDDVEGGEIVRDPGMGVFCDNAMDLVMGVWNKPGRERRREWVKSAMAELNKAGLVGMHDAGVLPEDVGMYEEMVGKEEWSVRVYAMYECPERNTFCPELVEKVETEDGMLKVRSVKLFADGALGSWGSAMLLPYSDKPETSGSLLVNASTLTTLARQWSKAGYQVNIHAIGDRANRYAIDALEAGLRGLCPWDKPMKECMEERLFRIEHAQIIHPDDQERMHALGIIPSIQPTHATSDMAYAEKRLGEERTRTEAYRMRSLLDLNPILGSDFPVEPPNPFEGIYAAMTRRSPHTGVGPPGHEKGWHTEEALSLDQALNGFTRAPARGGFYGTTAGVIEEGAFADWVVLDQDITGVQDMENLRKLKVGETWVGGRRVYARGEKEEKEEKAKEDL
ncbi:putative amidohydrolase YtcJ [Cladorrhinum sp. PSN332]|nr:putative amidohydrolase YtcJ [Cladorrhinum sp. PSN332]